MARTGWLGLARIWMDGRDHITQGTSQMNDTYFSTAAYDTANSRMHTMCHEVGRTFGLGHQSEAGSLARHMPRLFEQPARAMDPMGTTSTNSRSDTGHLDVARRLPRSRRRKPDAGGGVEGRERRTQTRGANWCSRPPTASTPSIKKRAVCVRSAHACPLDKGSGREHCDDLKCDRIASIANARRFG